MGKKLTEQQVLDKFEQVHGDTFDYSGVVYSGVGVKVKIGCRIHGVFEQTPAAHMKGQGCPTCGNILKGESRREGKAQTLIKEFKTVHGDTYDYSKVVYYSSKAKVLIGCKVHGVFEQSPQKHKSGQGCPKCGVTTVALSQTRTQEVAIKAFKGVHGLTYDYSLVQYVGSHTKVVIICPTHGEFLQEPHSHLKGNGCPECCREMRAES